MSQLNAPTSGTPSAISQSGDEFWEALLTEYNSRRSDFESPSPPDSPLPKYRSTVPTEEHFTGRPRHSNERFAPWRFGHRTRFVPQQASSHGEENIVRFPDDRTRSLNDVWEQFAYPLHRNGEFDPWVRNDKEPKSSSRQGTHSDSLINRVVDELNQPVHDNDLRTSEPHLSARALSASFGDFPNAPGTLSIMLGDLFPRDAETIYTYDNSSNPDMAVPHGQSADFAQLAESLANISISTLPSSTGEQDSSVIHHDVTSPSVARTLFAMSHDVAALIDFAVDADARVADLRETVTTRHEEQLCTTDELARRLREVADDTYDRLVQVWAAIGQLREQIAQVEDERRIMRRLTQSESSKEGYDSGTKIVGQAAVRNGEARHGSAAVGLGIHNSALSRGLHSSTSSVFRHRSFSGLRTVQAQSLGVVDEDMQLHRSSPASKEQYPSCSKSLEGASVLRRQGQRIEHENNELIPLCTEMIYEHERRYVQPQRGFPWGFLRAQLEAYVLASFIVAGFGLI